MNKTRAEKKQIRQEKKKIRRAESEIRSILEAYPIRDYIEHRPGAGYFLLSDGSIMDLFQIRGHSYLNASDDEVDDMVNTQTLFLRRYTDDMKLIAMNYPTNTKRQQKFLVKKLVSAPDSTYDHIIRSKLAVLQYLEQHTTSRQAFLMVFAKDHHRYEILCDLLPRSCMNVQVISQEKKEHILWQLNNMAKTIKI